MQTISCAQNLEVMRARSFNHFGPGQKENFVTPALTKRMLQASANGKAGHLSGKSCGWLEISIRRSKDVVRAIDWTDKGEWRRCLQRMLR